MYRCSCVGVIFVAGAASAVTSGFVEDFNNGTGGFGFLQGASVTTQLGGVGGASDAFLHVATTTVDPLAARAIDAPQYTGDYITAGVSSISFWLRDTGAADDDVIVRVAIGDQRSNFWVSNLGVAPTASWTQHIVDLTDASAWTQVIGSGSFSSALASTNVLQFRAAELASGRAPDSVLGDFGVDRIALIPAPGAGALLALAPLAVRRRR